MDQVNLDFANIVDVSALTESGLSHQLAFFKAYELVDPVVLRKYTDMSVENISSC